jgi:hypothetical protein
MRSILSGALGALAITASLSGAASAAPPNTKPEPAMTAIYNQQAATNMPDHVNNTRPDAGRGFIVAAGVEHGPTVAGEQRDQNMYDAN